MGDLLPFFLLLPHLDPLSSTTRRTPFPSLPLFPVPHLLLGLVCSFVPPSLWVVTSLLHSPFLPVAGRRLKSSLRAAVHRLSSFLSPLLLLSIFGSFTLARSFAQEKSFASVARRAPFSLFRSFTSPKTRHGRVCWCSVVDLIARQPCWRTARPRPSTPSDPTPSRPRACSATLGRLANCSTGV